ncbi:SRPBCC family protein [Dawidia soli]|uniref:SRPBCC domain-containing protein n=1 Tax=Dawidia soli TaxID=2782352 RepID=A0AAP2DBS0_9BACT|nr:SRPBCC domain-containing protein [Dawidia soli]MBT1688000.1 SRPBCC domain-containing protein [Dawidia soli]
MQSASQTKESVLTLTRQYDYPAEAVFNAFTEADALAEWWAPSDMFKVSALSLDFKPDGLFRFRMDTEEGPMWAKFTFGNIRRHDLIEFVLSFTDEKGTVTRAPFFESWPLEIFVRVTLEEEGGKTTLTLESSPFNATQQELDTFQQNKDSFRQGTEASLQRLEKILAR